jgi:hypothetical protein
MRAAALLLLTLLAGCSSLTVRAPICEPPPIPAELLIPCEEPIPPNEAGFASIYESYVRNVVGPWARCIRKDDQLIAIVKYRDATCAKIKADNAQPKRWWEF